jgi:hypothetical protein
LTVGVTSDLTVTYSLNGYQPQTSQVRTDPDGARLQPNPVFAELQPFKPGSAKKKAPAKPAQPAVTAADVQALRDALAAQQQQLEGRKELEIDNGAQAIAWHLARRPELGPVPTRRSTRPR